MGHCIRAIIGTHETVQKIADDWVRAKEIELPQGFGMIFCTVKLLEDIEELMESSGESIDDPNIPELEYYDAAAKELMETYSFRTKLAYIETDYFGGMGTQAGLLYENGKPAAPQNGEGAINALLKELGVWCKPDKDEFEMLGLGKYWHMEYDPKRS